MTAHAAAAPGGPDSSGVIAMAWLTQEMRAAGLVGEQHLFD